MSRSRRLLIAAGLLAEPVALRARGLPIGGRLVVRCRSGHPFTTLVEARSRHDLPLP